MLSIAVEPKEKGKNIAFEMEKYFCKKLKEKNISIVGLSVKKENIRAINFYKKCKYEIEKEEKQNVYYIKNII